MKLETYATEWMRHLDAEDLYAHVVAANVRSVKLYSGVSAESDSTPEIRAHLIETAKAELRAKLIALRDELNALDLTGEE